MNEYCIYVSTYAYMMIQLFEIGSCMPGGKKVVRDVMREIRRQSRGQKIGICSNESGFHCCISVFSFYPIHLMVYVRTSPLSPALASDRVFFSRMFGYEHILVNCESRE
jgi:hypothetical protein